MTKVFISTDKIYCGEKVNILNGYS